MKKATLLMQKYIRVSGDPFAKSVSKQDPPLTENYEAMALMPPSSPDLQINPGKSGKTFYESSRHMFAAIF